MKAIINGFRYNTEVSHLLGEASHGLPVDFDWWEAGLYRSPRAGRYFLAGNGGPHTRWGCPVPGGGIGGSAGIHPLTPEEALEWAEQFLAVEEVEAAFGDVVEDA